MLLILWISQILAINALVFNETLPVVDLSSFLQKAINNANRGTPKYRYESAALAKMTPGVCYSPFHNPEYPMNGGWSTAGLDSAIDADLNLIKNYFSHIRTYYTSYFGIQITPIAAKHKIRIYLGVYMTNEGWEQYQIADAINAVRDYPDTVSAVIFGNENIHPVGPYAPSDLTQRIVSFRAKVHQETGRNVPIGTVQRAAEWLEPSTRDQMIQVAANCDIIGVNIYPFFDNNYNEEYPLVILQAIWEELLKYYPAEKLRLTEIGWPTAGKSASQHGSNNQPSLANAQKFYNSFVNWEPPKGSGPTFWFMFFDRRPDDNTMQAELEKYFGFFTWDRKLKAPDYPARRTATSIAAAGATTTTPPTTTTAIQTPPPTTTPIPTSPPTTTPRPTPPPTTTLKLTTPPTTNPKPTSPPTATPTQAPPPNTFFRPSTSHPTTPTPSPTTPDNRSPTFFYMNQSSRTCRSRKIYLGS